MSADPAFTTGYLSGLGNGTSLVQSNLSFIERSLNYKFVCFLLHLNQCRLFLAEHMSHMKVAHRQILLWNTLEVHFILDEIFKT